MCPAAAVASPACFPSPAAAPSRVVRRAEPQARRGMMRDVCLLRSDPAMRARTPRPAPHAPRSPGKPGSGAACVWRGLLRGASACEAAWLDLQCFCSSISPPIVCAHPLLTIIGSCCALAAGAGAFWVVVARCRTWLYDSMAGVLVPMLIHLALADEHGLAAFVIERTCVRCDVM